jgi:hypothetical protein
MDRTKGLSRTKDVPAHDRLIIRCFKKHPPPSLPCLSSISPIGLPEDALSLTAKPPIAPCDFLALSLELSALSFRLLARVSGIFLIAENVHGFS